MEIERKFPQGLAVYRARLKKKTKAWRGMAMMKRIKKMMSKTTMKTNG